MKTIFNKSLASLSLVVLFTFQVLAQSPKGFSYQAVIRNSNGQPLGPQSVKLHILLTNNLGTVTYYGEEHTTTTSPQGIASLTIGEGSLKQGTLAEVPWQTGEIYIKIEVDVTGTGYQSMGSPTRLNSVPYALFADNTKEVVSQPDATDDAPIFVVKNKDGKIVFAVYQGGVRINVEDSPIVKSARGGFAVGGLSQTKAGIFPEYFRITPDSARIYTNKTLTKGARGGFAVGGLSQTKAIVEEYLQITPDSARIYINNSATVKGARGGFAVGGLSQTKGINPQYLRITPDSARIYIDNSTVKGARGGFAVGGLSQTKLGGSKDFIRITPDSTRIYVTNQTLANTSSLGGFAIKSAENLKSEFFNVSSSATAKKIVNESRVMWYPSKSALLAGEISVLHPDSVGQNSMALGYRNISKGSYSQAMGYQSIARGDYSTAIGYFALANKTNSFAFGYQAKATNFDSYAFGSGAVASGNKSFAFGSVGIDSTGLTTGIPTENTRATGDYAFAFGQGSLASGKASIAFGANNISSGSFSTAIGYKTTASQWYSTAMGGYTTASNYYTVAMGYKSTASGLASVAFGCQSTASGVYSFACGDGAKAIGARSIALGAYSTAQGAYSFAVGYSSVTSPSATAATALGRETNAAASNSTAMGYQSTSSGLYSLAGGNISTASGIASIALGDHANASANYSIALGRNVTASTQYAIAIGNTTTASGDNSTAFGNQTTAVGKYSLAVGYGCTANAYSSTAVGSYNVVEGTPGSWIATDPIFMVGNGTSSSSLSNAVTVYKDGTMKLKSNFYPELTTATLGTSGNKWNTVFATNGTINTSDLRLKDNITEIAYGLTEILKLKPVSFLWKKNPQEGRKLGFIAQDVKPIISEVVVEGDDPEKTLGMNYSSIIPVIVKGMQEQQQQIDKQKQQIEDLIATNKKLLEIVEKLEAKSK